MAPPAIADILQALGSLAVYAVDSLLMPRSRNWNYRRLGSADGTADAASMVPVRAGCPMFFPETDHG